MVDVLFFAGMKEKIGQAQVNADIAGKTVREIKLWVEQTYTLPKGSLERTMIAVNEEFVEDTDYVKSGDTIAFIPPVSGG
ncbi:molybdopterin converting factor subunit 1 [Geomicrobium sediminis]|uniref:Molybdopterin synthase sulfur carrier subunit n=1 Tax=Geomicrobium sediminis TaxID=1347788 RepID=A0ABS2P9B3_9BACL|nr:molybdopterin converting factor subunit 1 [Geomicrobium sediminis]MBM7631907.1 molybdopterin synthase sulfur carrier subunit [Geomicrobium sediminis]